MKNFIAFLVLMLGVALTGITAETRQWNVANFGAKGDGATKDTAALQKALDACGQGGGGVVLVPDGVYLTGSLVIHAGTTLRLASRAVLLGSPDIADYPLETVRWEGEFRDGHRALLSATNAANVGISGGAIFGPPPTLSKLRSPRGPVLIELTGCTNAVLENFTSQYQQLWSIHALFCENLTVSNLIIRSVRANGDGVDVDSCDHVLIDHCDINTGDDAISLKSGRGLAAQLLLRPTQNVVIQNCRLESSIYAALGLGTEMSGGIRDVKLQDCVLSGRQNAIFIKSREGRGGFMENIAGENLVILKSPTFIGMDLIDKGIPATDPVLGNMEQWARVQNISFQNVSVEGVGQLVAATGVPPERPVDGFALANISGECGRAISLANMTRVALSKIHVTGFRGPLVTVRNVTGAGLDDSAMQ